MADASFSAGSDEECEILVGMVHDRFPREYAHQPIRIVESETSDENPSTTASEEESTAEEATENRLALVNTWCRCGMCESETLGDEKEAICCSEVTKCLKMIAAEASADKQCITLHPDFDVLCLHTTVLRNVLVSLNHTRMDHWNISNLDNRLYRWAAYRQFTWVHAVLGARIRRVVPACAVNAIRKAFPEVSGDYTGYQSADD
ncbi:hypothetical protein CAPTEDRAFT_198831 [Capitella teleta]|uniref:P2X purinoreceptor 7 intracellular domain-containing protein n=1 Tax=Capitella teleta TaxID=283909 RepID=R7T3R9_CAPTE|nr:hypothetical protein CAPTEDRAFT_198831 [Capitella teleta]|eukprot:ELT87457.1 hypothetical protein CAPTEDRAFT_198831 [Capitella teleta]